MWADSRGLSGLALVPSDLAALCRTLIKVVEGARGKALIDDLRAAVGGTAAEIVSQALFADCLRVVHSAVIADGMIDDREIDALYSIIAVAARHYVAAPRSQYAEFPVDDRDSARAFLDRYAADRSVFGLGARLRWPGLTLCRRAAELGEREPLQRYTKAMTVMCSEAGRLAGASEGDPRRRGSTHDLDELRRILACEATDQPVDRRVQAFLAPCRVFSAVQQASSIFENDPFDVEAVHSEARASFAQLVAQATMRPQPPDLGRMLVVLGDSGAGKTHVLRGFRRHVQEGNRGFVIYAQLQSRSGDYSRYLLFHFIESLSRRYSEQSGRTGLRELASGLLRLATPSLRKCIERLIDDTWEAHGNLADYIDGLVNELLRVEDLQGDRDLLRVLLYALRPDPRTTSSVYKYLRCEAMSAHDRRWIGDVEPRTHDDAPHWMILALARIAAATGRALVVMVDQVDLAGFGADSTSIFLRAIDALYRIVSESPSAVAVVSCLSDLYEAVRPSLNRPALDRLEKAPPVARLQINRSYAEIEAVVARRLSALFTEYGTVHRPEQPVYPIPEGELRLRANHRMRDVLEWCHQFQVQCAAAGKIITADESITIEVKTREHDLDEIAAAWNEAILAPDLEIPDEEDEILDAVAEAAKVYAHELGLALDEPVYRGRALRLKMSRGDERADLSIAVVNQSFRGGAFTERVHALRRSARAMVPVAVPIVVRTLEFPRGPACDKAMGQLVDVRGRGAYLDASTLRALVAFQRFHPPFPEDRIAAWRLRDRPISSLPAVVEIFDFDRSLVDLSVGRGRRAMSEAGEARSTGEYARTPEADADAGDEREESAGRTAARTQSASSRSANGRSDTPRRTRTRSSPAIEIPAAREGAVVAEAGTLNGAHARGATSDQEVARAAKNSTEVSASDHQPERRDEQEAPSDARDSSPASVSNGARMRGANPEESARPAVTGTADQRTQPPRSTSERTVPRPAASPAGFWIGNSTGFDASPIVIGSEVLLGHVGIVDGGGGGRLTAVLNLVEQALDHGVPAILLDRTGEMAGYARPEWWQRSDSPARARALAERLDVRLFTPGIREGRPLSLAVIPDLTRVPPTEQDRVVRLAAGSLFAAMRTGTGGDDVERLGALTDAVGALARRSASGGLAELIGSDELAAACGDPALRHRLIEDLAALLGNPDVFASGAEPLTAATLIGPSSDGRVPLAIVHTGFLGDGPRLRSWFAQLVGALVRELPSSTSDTLRAVVGLDGADLLLPVGAGKTLAKEPLQELLKRAGAIDLGVLLVSQRPAELDYRRAASIETWFVGKTDEPTLEKMKALFERRPLGHRKPSRLESGRFVMLHEDGALDVERAPPLLRIEAIEGGELHVLAARSHPRARKPVPAPRTEAAPEPQPVR